MINLFVGKYRFLSNFWICEVPIPHPHIYNDKEHFTYPSTEHAFQAAKSHDVEYHRLIHSLANPGDAKKEGKTVKLREDWEEVKDNIMHRLVFLKFLFNKELRIKLLETGDQEIVEGNNWCDTYWGKCYCIKHKNIGKNKLGEILMKVRQQLKDHNAS